MPVGHKKRPWTETRFRRRKGGDVESGRRTNNYWQFQNRAPTFQYLALWQLGVPF